MSINEVYAINIQPRQFVRDLRVFPDDIETEREKFLQWLNEVDKNFQSQMDAWNVYIAPFFSISYEIRYMNDLNEDAFVLETILGWGWGGI